MYNLIKNILTLITIILLSAFCAYKAPQYLSFIKFIQFWEDDARIATLLPTEAQHSEIIIVTITEETLSRFTYRSPIDRHFVSSLLTNLEAIGARAIFLDFLFDQPTEKEKDQQLYTTLLALKIPVVVSYGDNSAGINLNPEQQNYLNDFLPTELRGLANISKDHLGTVRWIYPGHYNKEGHFINSAVNLLSLKLGHFYRAIHKPLNRISWHGSPDSDTSAFRSFPAHMVRILPAAWFKDKIVLIGSELNITDRHRTPFSIAPELNKETTQTGTPGIFIHAHSLAHVLDQRRYPSIDNNALIQMIILAALLGILFAHIKTRLYLNIILGGLSLILFWLLGIGFFSYSGLLVPLTLPTLSFTISFILTTLYIGRTEHLEKQLALEETRVKSRFLANMSHEIRSPMTAIIGMTEITLESNIDAQQRKYLTTVLSSARALLNLINDILDLSKLESGKMQMENLTFDLRQMLEDTITTLSTQAEVKGLELHLQVSKSLPACFIGDPLRLRQVILNLTNNAIKFTSQGSVEVTVRADKKKNDALLFAIKDTGMGIPVNRQAAVFESFTQADGSTSRMHGGTGLGTTISRQIVEKMHGRIWLKSKEGKGSTFYFSVHIPPATSIDSCKIEYGVAHNLVSEHQRSLKILVVDDIDENLQLCSIRLQQKKHQVFLARDGLEAVTKWQAAHFDVILMDAQMPKMDGFEATKTIRSKEIKQQVKQSVPIIAMTANAMKGDREKCLAAGMNDYISKPIDFNQLFATINKVVPDDTGVSTADLDKANIETRQAITQNTDPFYNLRGIDTETGLFVWGNKEAYKKSLISFALSHADDAHKITSAWQQGDYAQAKNISHALKGVAGNLSMPRLAEISTVINQALHESPDSISRQLDDLTTELEAIVSAIGILSRQQTKSDRHVKKRPQSAAENTLPLTDTDTNRKLMTLLHSLNDFLEAGDAAAAEETIEMIHNTFADTLPVNVLSGIIAQIDVFDFSQAQDSLKGMLETLENNSE